MKLTQKDVEAIERVVSGYLSGDNSVLSVNRGAVFVCALRACGIQVPRKPASDAETKRRSYHMIAIRNRRAAELAEFRAWKAAQAGKQAAE